MELRIADRPIFILTVRASVREPQRTTRVHGDQVVWERIQFCAQIVNYSYPIPSLFIHVRGSLCLSFTEKFITVAISHDVRRKKSVRFSGTMARCIDIGLNISSSCQDRSALRASYRQSTRRSFRHIDRFNYLIGL